MGARSYRRRSAVSFRFNAGWIWASGIEIGYGFEFGSGEDRGALGIMADPRNIGGNIIVLEARKHRIDASTTEYAVKVQNIGAVSAGYDVIGGGLT
jgi:hypothetical protein